MTIQKLLSTRLLIINLCVVFILAYVILPISVHVFYLDNEYFLKLAQLTVVAVIMITIGYLIPIFDWRFSHSAKRLHLDAQAFHVIVWSFFLIFVIFTIATAESVPLVSALRGATASVLSEQRGGFLKARLGAEAILAYLSTIFVSALLPYSLASLFINRNRSRYLMLFIFLCYSVSFLQKALFLNALFPLLYIFIVYDRKRISKLFYFVVAGSALLWFLTTISFENSTDNDTASAIEADGEYWTANYLAKDPTSYLIWRIVAVPMFTAADTLHVFTVQFSGKWFWGATSSFFSTLFSLDRIQLEKIVYEYQWGWNPTANANANYITEAYVNFGLIGVVFFSLFVGQSLRWFRRSRDYAIKSLWPIYCFAIFSSGLIGTLLSNGYTIVFFISLFLKISQPAYRKRHATINERFETIAKDTKTSC
jgi:hypothetical protein